MNKILLLPVVFVLLSISAMAQNTKEQKNREQNTNVSSSDISTATASAIEIQEQEKIKEMQKDQADWEKWEKKVIETLKLTKTQKLKLDTINQEFNENIASLKLSKTKTKDEAHKKDIDSKMEEVKKVRESDFMKLLTPAQLAKYKEMVEKRNNEIETQTIRKPVQGAPTRVEQ